MYLLWSIWTGRGIVVGCGQALWILILIANTVVSEGNVFIISLCPRGGGGGWSGPIPVAGLLVMSDGGWARVFQSCRSMGQGVWVAKFQFRGGHFPGVTSSM